MEVLIETINNKIHINSMILDFREYLNRIDEGLIKTYNIDIVIEKSYRNLSVLNVPFKIEKLGDNQIKLILNNFKNIYISQLFNLLNQNFTNLFGWFPAYMYMTNLSGMENRMNYDERYLINTFQYLENVVIIYESKFDIEQKMPNKLYHISIKEYENKILKIGIVPKTKNKLSTHGDRIYVCASIEDCMSLLPKMKFYFYNKSERIDTKWIIYEIDTSGLNLKLYKDSNSLGYYLIGNIPPTKIKVAKEEN